MSDRITEIIDSQFSDITSYKTPEEQSPLYIAIAEKYNDITGETLPEESYEENCAKIWKWYYNKYSYPDMARGHGLSRSVSRTTPETEYHFDIPYQLPQFTADILGYIRFYTITVNQFVVQEFIKHICVAFKLDKYTCNDCLTAYGYLPLHSKNLHDLAVYSVLSTTENCEADINPLSLVKERYLKALDLLRGSSGMPTPHKTISTSLLTGKDKASEAAKGAISSPLLETTITGAKGILISITASPDIALDDINIAADLISSEAAEDATVIFGAAFDETLEDTMKVSIIATGFQNKSEADPTFNKKGDGSTIRPFTSGKIKSGVKDQIIVSKDSATKQTQEEEKKDKTDDSPISDDDFNEILEMLNMGKNRNQAQAKEQNNTNGFPKRY